MGGVNPTPRRKRTIRALAVAAASTAILIGGAVAADAATSSHRPRTVGAVVRVDKLDRGDFAVVLSWHAADGTVWEAVQAADGEGGLYLQYERPNGRHDLRDTVPEVDIDNGQTHRLRAVQDSGGVTLYVDGGRVLDWRVDPSRS